MNTRFNMISAAVAMSLGAAMAVASAADTTTTSQDAADAAPVQEVIITGSNIPTASSVAAMPVTVIDAHQIAETGTNSNVLEIIRKSVPSVIGRSVTGNANANNVNQNTAGGSRLQIRNLDTLVLINGRRVASSGIGAVGGKDFVDVNQIPSAAIERLEVLTDGASAIYGSDAVGGVVNIILKKNFKGMEAGARYGGAAGGYRERSAYIVGGLGNSDANITATASWSRTSPLFQNQRPFSSRYFALLRYPGVANNAYLKPGLTSPSQTNPTGVNATAGSLAALIANGTYLAANNPAIAPGIASQFDLSPYQTLLLQQDQKGITLNGSASLFDDRLEVFGDYVFSATEGFNQTFQGGNNLTTVTVPAKSPFDPLTTAFPNVTTGDLADPLQTFNKSRGNRVTLGLRGDISTNWNWEAAGTYSDNELTQRLQNVVYLPNLTAAIAGGYDASGNLVTGGAYSRVLTGFGATGSNYVVQPALDPFARGAVNSAAWANLLGTEVIKAASKLSSVDAKIVGTPIDLPAGKFGVAVGAAFRRETQSATPDLNSRVDGPTARSWGGGSYFNPFSAGRNVTSAYIEGHIPVTSPTWSFPGFNAFEISVAGRTEHYSDAGNSRVPKFGLRWQPFDEQATFRFAYSRAYNAPPLYSTLGPTYLQLSSATVLATQLANPAFTGQIYNQENTSNPNLKPTNAWTRSFGVVLAPNIVPGLTVTVDYINVSEEGFQSGNGTVLASADQLGAASPYANQVAFFNYPGQPGAVPITTPHQISNYLLGGGSGSNIYTVGYMVNLAGISVHATDVTINYQLPTTSLGRFAFNTSGSYLNSYKFQAFADQQPYQYAGFATNGGVGVQGTLPKYHLYTTLDWTFNQWEAVLASTYIPSVTDIGPGGKVFYTNPNAVARHVSCYSTWDMQLSYTLRTWESSKVGGKAEPGLQFTVGANNLFNRMPPLSPQAFPDNRADVGVYSPLGRLIFGSITAKF